MKPHSQGHADRKRDTPTADASADQEKPFRGRDLRIDATPEQLAAVIGATPPKAAHEWSYLKRKPVQSDGEVELRRDSKPGDPRST